MKRSARAGPSRSNNAPPAAAGAPCKASPTSPSSSPTWTQPPNGDSTNSTPSANSSPPAHGYHRHPNQLNSYGGVPIGVDQAAVEDHVGVPGSLGGQQRPLQRRLAR